MSLFQQLEERLVSACAKGACCRLPFPSHHRTSYREQASLDVRGKVLLAQEEVRIRGEGVGERLVNAGFHGLFLIVHTRR